MDDVRLFENVVDVLHGIPFPCFQRLGKSLSQRRPDGVDDALKGRLS